MHVQEVWLLQLMCLEPNCLCVLTRCCSWPAVCKTQLPAPILLQLLLLSWREYCGLSLLHSKHWHFHRCAASKAAVRALLRIEAGCGPPAVTMQILW